MIDEILYYLPSKCEWAVVLICVGILGLIIRSEIRRV